MMIERSGYRLLLDDSERIDDLVVAVADGSLGFEPWLSGSGQVFERQMRHSVA
jgi:hypothetical protein